MRNSHLVVFGHDTDGNPRACRFPEADAAIAIKAAHTLGYRTLQLGDAELAQELPLGNVFARGAAFIRRTSRRRFERLVAAADDSAGHTTSARR